MSASNVDPGTSEDVVILDLIQRLETDYPEALVRLASFRAKGRHHILFGWIELYPFDMTAPPSWKAGERPWSVPGQSGWSCGISATRMSTPEAIGWYVNAASGQANIAVGAATPTFARTNLVPEPAWGHFATSVDAPFALPWHDGPRIHRLVPMSRPARDVWELSKSDRARGWLEAQIGFDVLNREDWIGSLALLAPDPVCASFKLFRSARLPSGAETLSIEVVPRRTAARTADLTSLQIHVAERRADAWASLKTQSVAQDGFCQIEAPQPTDQVAWAITCAERGLLRTSAPNPWLDQINIGMAMVHGTVRVEVPPGGRRKPAQTYEVSQLAPVQPSVVGGPVDDRARKRLLHLMWGRKARQDRASTPQRIFGLRPGRSQPTLADIEEKKKEAQDFICGLVGSARKRLIFVDPFFGPREMRLFGLRNPQHDVVPRILTGLLGLKVMTADQAPGFQVQQGLNFVAELRQLREKLGDRAPAVRVMPGQDQAVIHDRYLVVDDQVWHCGPSFNELGERLGVIVRLPNPLQVRAMVGRVWVRSTPLAEKTS